MTSPLGAGAAFSSTGALATGAALAEVGGAASAWATGAALALARALVASPAVVPLATGSGAGVGSTFSGSAMVSAGGGGAGAAGGFTGSAGRALVLRKNHAPPTMAAATSRSARRGAPEEVVGAAVLGARSDSAR